MTKKKCELHGTPLTAMAVPIRYGMQMFDSAWDVEKELFPNAKTYVLGGCVMDDDNPTTESRLVCEECRNSEAAWRRENDLYESLSEH